MSITMTDQAVTFKPTPWKWYTLATICLILLPLLHIFALLTGVFALMQATGKATWVRMDRDGIASQHFWKERHYRWEDVQDFRIQTLRVNFFFPVRNLVFSRRDKADTAFGKFSRFVSGGTEAVPVPNGNWKALLSTAQGFQQAFAEKGGHSPAVSAQPVHTPARVTPEPAPARARPSVAAAAPKAARTAQKQTPIAQPATPLVQEGGWGLFRKDRSSIG